MEKAKRKLEREKQLSPTKVAQLRREADKAIRLNEERFAALLRHNPSLLFLKDDNGKYVYLNPAYEKQYALGPDWFGKTDFDFWPKESAELFRQNDAKVLESGEVCQFLEDSLDLNGNRHCWLCYKFPFTDSQGKLYVGGIGIDSTARVLAEEALKESERVHALQSAVLESVRDPLWATDSDLRIVYWNDAAAAAFGWTADEVQGRNTGELFRTVVSGSTRDDAVTQLLQTGEYHGEVVCHCRDGRSMLAEVSSRLVRGIDGAVVRVVNTARDITERKRAEEALRESEERLSLAISASRAMIYDMDPRTGRILAIRGAETLVGSIPSAEEMTLQWWDARIHPEDLPLCQATLQCRQSGRHRLEYRVRNDDGGWLHVEDHATIVCDDSGRLVRVVGTVVDITERKQAEEKLRESEEKYRTLFESIDQGFCVIEVLFDADDKPFDYRFLLVNPAFEKQTGIEDAVGRRMKEIAPKLEEHWFQIYGNIALTGEPIHFENPAEQLHRYYDVSAWRVGEPAERKVAVLFNDLTERRRGEQALGESRVQLEEDLADTQLLQRISAEFLNEDNITALYEKIIDAAAQIMRSEFASLQMFHAERGELQLLAFRGFDQNAAKFWEWVNTSGRSICSEALRTGQRVIVPDLEKCNFMQGTEDLAIYMQTGIHACQTTPLLSRSGKLVGMISTHWRTPHQPSERDLRLWDILARQAADLIERKQAHEALKESEARHRRVVENTTAIILRVDPKGIIRFANGRALEFFGYSLEELIGKPALGTIVPERETSGRDLTAMVDQIVNNPDQFHSNANENMRKNGERVWLEWTNSGIYHSDGTLKEFLSVGIDCTERKKAEEALYRLKNELEIRVHERTAELAKAHHDLTMRAGQLRALAGELTLAEQRERRQLAHVLHDGLQQILVGAKFRLGSASRSQNVKSALDEVSELIDDAIETSRSLTAELSPTILVQGNLVSALEWLARWMQDKYDLDVSLTARRNVDNLPQDLILLLFQAVRELLFNVVKHAGVKSARVIVNQLGGRILITVEDQGVGFVPKQLRAKGGEAGGIGLFSVGERLSHMGGRLRIESAPGRGSRFKLTVPYLPANTTTETADVKRQVSVAMSSLSKSKFPHQKQKRIVLVDDHLVMRQGLAGLLRLESDFEIVGEASDGAAAVELVRELKPDVILMDASMPGMDGIEATRIIHQELPNIRIIGLSMFPANEQAVAMREAGAVDYVTKSGASELLIAAIRSCVKA